VLLAHGGRRTASDTRSMERYHDRLPNYDSNPGLMTARTGAEQL